MEGPSPFQRPHRDSSRIKLLGDYSREAFFDLGGQGQRTFVFLVIAFLVVNCGHRWYINGTFPSAS